MKGGLPAVVFAIALGLASCQYSHKVGVPYISKCNQVRFVIAQSEQSKLTWQDMTCSIGTPKGYEGLPFESPVLLGVSNLPSLFEGEPTYDVIAKGHDLEPFPNFADPEDLNKIVILKIQSNKLLGYLDVASVSVGRLLPPLKRNREFSYTISEHYLDRPIDLNSIAFQQDGSSLSFRSHYHYYLFTDASPYSEVHHVPWEMFTIPEGFHPYYIIEGGTK